VWHWTGGTSGNAAGTSTALWDWLLKEAVDPSRKASWHFSISRTGVIAQHAPLSASTWHAGCDPAKSKCQPTGQIFGYPKPPIPPFPVRNANTHFVGVELENGGIVLEQDKKFYVWPYAKGLTNCSGTSQCGEVTALSNSSKFKFEKPYEVAPGRVVNVRGKLFDAYTQSQVKAATELTRALKDSLGWWSPQQANYGHYQFIDSKLDPGLFWVENILPKLQQDVFGSSASAVGAGSAYAALLALGTVGVGYYLWRRSRA